MAPALATTTSLCLPSSSPSHHQVQLHRHVTPCNGHNHIQHHRTFHPLHSSGVLAHAEHQSCRKATFMIDGIIQVHGIYHASYEINREFASRSSAPQSCRCHAHSVAHHYSSKGNFQHGFFNNNGAVHLGNYRGFKGFTGSFDSSSKRFRHYRTLAMSADASAGAPSKNKGVAILWFKKDLRLDDHLGLYLSTAYQALLPIYIFDPYLLRAQLVKVQGSTLSSGASYNSQGWSLDMIEALVEAVAELKLALQGVGSDLIIRRGNVKVELTSLAAEVHATDIIAEEELEHEWREAVFSISDNSLNDSINGSLKINVETWESPLYESKGKPFPCSYKEFRKTQYLVKPPMEAPKSLPALPEMAKKGSIPPASVIEDDVRVLFENKIWHKRLKDIRSKAAETLLSIKDEISGDEMLSETKRGVLEGLKSWREKYILASPYEALEKRRQELALNSKEEEVKKSSGVGATSIMGTLDAYLRFLEPTRRKDWRLLYEAVSEAEYYGPRGASFRRLFGDSLTLGTVSRRRIYYEAFEYEKARNGGWSSPFGFSTFTAKAAVDDVKSSEWYRMLAAASEEDSRKRGWHVQTWCWRGFLIEYTAMGEHGLPIVLVHGFGAFWEHYRDNIPKLSEDGNRVWALTLLGFGRSEKPDVAYTELLWAELIRDFIVEVVGEPAILVGNSIGGYMVSMVAGLWPQIVKSLILLNTAGAILPKHSSSTYTKPSARTGVTWAGSQVSLTYLRSAASQLLKKFYSVNPARVDEWLIGEILRASHDPGAAIVLESFYCLKNPFPLNWFLDRYKGKVFVIQGSKDPLSNSTQRKQLFESYCSNSLVQIVNAGHCPHDEIPDEVNKFILDWLQQTHSQQAEAATHPQAVQYVENV